MEKNYPNTGSVGGAGTDSQTWKMNTSFLMSLAQRQVGKYFLEAVYILKYVQAAPISYSLRLK